MRYVFTAAFVAVGMLTSVADAALQTTTMQAVEDEVRARHAALANPVGKAEKRLKRDYRLVLKQIDMESTKRKHDRKRIARIVKLLSQKRHRADAELQALLTEGVNAFMAELGASMDDMDRKLGLFERPINGTPKVEELLGKARDVFGVAQGKNTLAKMLRRCVKAEVLVEKAQLKTANAVAEHGPIAVHRFTYDIETDEYVVPGGRYTQADVDRDLVGTLCNDCHDQSTHDLKNSVHYNIRGRSDQVLFPGGGQHGMFDRACGLPATTGLTNYLSDINLGECSKCHVGRYLPVMEGFFAKSFGEMGVANPQAEATKLIDSGLDCLICHADDYASRPRDGVLASVSPIANPDRHSPNVVGSARDSRDDADFDRDGRPDLVIDVNGDGIPDAPLMMDTDGDGMPETPWRTVAQDRSLEALRSIGETTSHSCMRCHEHARTGYKRGTLWVEGHDFHGTEAGGEFEGVANTCTVCHEADQHKFKRGHSVGGDLMASDYPDQTPGQGFDPNDPTDVACESCHTASTLPGSIHSERHLATIACETCHITAGAGITYSLFGEGGHVAFGRNPDGKDTKLLVADAYVTSNETDLLTDWEAYKTEPILAWFDGNTSFLAQPLGFRGKPNTKIAPFKPMANGMVFDARYFSGETMANDVGYQYNAHSMYRFYANGVNAEAFDALGMLDMTPQEVRSVTPNAFFSTDPDAQAMGLMQIFPNLVYFDKANYGYEHYLTRTGSPFDVNQDGVIDAGADFHFDMFAAANSGLRQFQGFNGAMDLPADYEWYPPFEDVSQTISMKLPDGSLIKMFLQMQGANLPEEQREQFMAAVDNYPAFSQVTLGGHSVRPKEQAIGSCSSCHSEGGLMSHKVPVTRKVPVNMGPMMGTIEFPLYQWKFYNVKQLVELGLTTTSAEVVAGTADVDVDGDTNYLRISGTQFALNWFMPDAPDGYRSADDSTALLGTHLAPEDLTWSGGDWMPVLEPVTDQISNARVLGYGQDFVPMFPQE